ncbi:MAG: hypothetical protein PHC62_00325 [Candidatus Izemoplasmatales bacterium]|nr:hypothetical protein [Candidatus Izemoplasmatales bacterium]
MTTYGKKHHIFKFLALFIVGFNFYISIETCFRGYSYPAMGLMGAVAFILIDAINSKISWDIPFAVQAIIGSLIVTLLELIVGIFLLKVFNVRMWDYSNLWGNYLGLISPLFTFLWFLLSFFCILLSDTINYYIFNEQPRPFYRSITGKILFKLPERY